MGEGEIATMSGERPFRDNKVFTEEMANSARTRLREKLALIEGEKTIYADRVARDDQIMNFDDEDEDVSIDDLLPFILAEKELIEKIESIVRKRMVAADPVTLRKIASFLYALERLPYTTPEVSLDFAIMERVCGNLSYVSVELDSQSFRLSTGGSIYSPDVGSDSFSETMFQVEMGGFRDGSTEAFNDWLVAFASAGGYVEVQGDDDADLTEETPEDGWVRLGRYWESQEDDLFGW